VTGQSDAGQSECGDMEDSVTLDVPSFSFVHCFPSLDLGPLEIVSA